VLVEATDPGSRLTALFEDDGRTGYAYILEGGRIVADVWVYNHGEAPSEPEWDDHTKAPFRNPRAFVRPQPVEPARTPADVRLVWTAAIGTSPPSVSVQIRGERYARLVPGAKPGWARLAATDGPLARALLVRTCPSL
jgi:hypothetical protein